MAQGDEGIFLYKNKGNGTFEEQKLLSFLPLFGSQYFELIDFNNDGHEDILYVCGDNADLSTILKQYHGIYIYLNDGSYQFSHTVRVSTADGTSLPPDQLVLQTHTPFPLRDLDLLAALPCCVHISVETDRDSIPGLPPHAFSPRERLAALRTLKESGLDAVGVVAPLLPIEDPEAFARALDEACTRVIVDHYLVGDGSKHGARTKRRGLPERLIEHGFERWTTLEVLHETAAVFARVLGPERVGVSREGFNA